MRAAAWIAVLAAALLWSLPTQAGQANLCWTPPTQNTDGSPLTDLAGYKIYAGCNTSGTYELVPDTINDPTATCHIYEGLPNDTLCYFVGTALNTSGVESAYSNEAQKLIPPLDGEPPGKPVIDVTWPGVEPTDPGGEPVMAFPDDWTRRVAVEIQASEVGATLTDFPLLLTADSLPSEMFDADGSSPAQNGGGDIRVTSDAAGTTLLPLEVVSFVTDNDPANGHAELWTKVPSVSASVNTTVYVWYNTAVTESQPAVTDAAGRNAVWSDYYVVMHDGATDSTGNITPTVSGATSVEGVFGTTNGARDYDGADDSTHNDFAGSVPKPRVISAWIKPDAVAQGVIGAQYGFLRFEGIYVTSTGTIRDESWDSGVEQGVETTGTVSSGTWHHVYGREISDSSRYAGLDGVSSVQGTASINGRDSDIRWGENSYKHDDFAGVMAEMRYRDGDVSADWLTAEYNNQSSPSTFAIASAPESTDFSYVGGATDASTSGATASVTHGLTIQEGDLVVGYVNSNSTTAVSGATGALSQNNPINEIPTDETARQALFWGIAGASEPASYAVTVGGNTNWRIIVKVFRPSSGTPVVDAAANSAVEGTIATNLLANAYDGQIISDNAVAVVFAGKDRRNSDVPYSLADNGYTGVLGEPGGNNAAGAHRIYTTGETGSGNITIQEGFGADPTYSVHMSFVIDEGGAALTLDGSSISESTLAALLNRFPGLAATATSESEVAGSANLFPALTGESESESALTALLNRFPGLAGSTISESQAQALLDGGIGLAGSSVSESTLSGALGLLLRVSGALSSESALDASLGLDVALSGEVVSTSDLQGALSLLGELLLSGAITSWSDADGSLAVALALAGDLDSVSDEQARLDLSQALVGVSISESVLSANLQLLAQFLLTGSIDSESHVAAVLGLTQGLAGSLAAESDLAAFLDLLSGLRGSSDSVTHLVGTLGLELALRGDSESVSELAAALSLSLVSGTLTVDVIKFAAALEGAPSLRAALDAESIDITPRT